MKKAQNFYIILVLVFLAMNAIAYFFFFAPSLKHYKEYQEELLQKKAKKEYILQTQDIVAKYKKIEPLYIEANKIYEKLALKKFQSADIKRFLNELGRKVGVPNITPQESQRMNTDGTPLTYDGEQPKVAADIVEYRYVTYSFSNIFTFAQLTNFLTSLLRDERIFILRSLDLTPTSRGEASGEVEIKPNEEYLKVNMVLDFVYFQPNEEEAS